jgi:hypothetical protein
VSDRALKERLREIPLADEAGAEERGWRVVSAAYADRAPLRPRYPFRRVALILAASLAILALLLTPAGADVVDAVEEVIGVSEEDARPALRSLPTGGEVLVQSEAGPWIVREDGSKRLLGDYGDATWSSPRGLYVAATDGRQLVAVDSLGEVRWTVTAPERVINPRWSPSGLRIAYRSGEDLRVVAADGTDDRLLTRDVAPVAPAWRPIPETKVQAPGMPETEQLSFVASDGTPRLVDADTGELIPGVSPAPFDREQLGRIREIAWSPDGDRFMAMSRRAVLTDDVLQPDAGNFNYVSTGSTTLVGAALASNGDQLAVLERGAGRSKIRLLELVRDERSPAAPLFAGPGAIADLAWSPDGRWLLAGWRSADQWLFLRAERPRRLVAVDDISRQFAPGDSGQGAFPRLSGWILPQR